jgi:hypothetical protein
MKVTQTAINDHIIIELNIIRDCRGYFFETYNQKIYVFLTKHFDIPAFTVTLLYKNRWKIELFFKWIKQHLRIKSSYETSLNAMKTQIWICISVYVMIAIIKKTIKIEMSLYKILQIFNIYVFEKVSFLQLLTKPNHNTKRHHDPNQLILFSS